MDGDHHHRDPDSAQRRHPQEEPPGDLHQRHQLVTGAWTMKPTFRKTGNPVLHIHSSTSARGAPLVFALLGVTALAGCAGSMRSEEHTSELQSLMRISYAVFCLQKKHNSLYKKQQQQLVYHL